MRELGRAVEIKDARVAMSGVSGEGRFSGYASLFGVVDLGRDLVEPGAFSAALRRRGSGGVRMLYQHEPGEPIGVWETLREDGRGLWVSGRLAATARGNDVRELLKSGAIDGLSIGFRTIRARRDPATGVRRIIEADLWEISIVTFPMLPGARVERVKAAPTEREFERWLRREAGLSRAAAKTVIARGYGDLKRGRDASQPGGTALASRLRAVAHTLNHKETRNDL